MTKEVRPRLTVNAIESARRYFPTVEGDDASFVRWLVHCAGCGMLTAVGQPRIQEQQPPTLALKVEPVIEETQIDDRPINDDDEW